MIRFRQELNCLGYWFDFPTCFLIYSFECPPGFQQVEISAEDEQIYLDDIQGSEFWLIKTPHDVSKGSSASSI